MARCRSPETATVRGAFGVEGAGHDDKRGRLRYVPMTERLAAALQAHRHLRGQRVLVRASGEPFTMKIVQEHVARAARTAGVKPGVPHPSPYALLPPRDGRRASEGDSGTSGSQGS